MFSIIICFEPLSWTLIKSNLPYEEKKRLANSKFWDSGSSESSGAEADFSQESNISYESSSSKSTSKSTDDVVLTMKGKQDEESPKSELLQNKTDQEIENDITEYVIYQEFHQRYLCVEQPTTSYLIQEIKAEDEEPSEEEEQEAYPSAGIFRLICCA